MSSVLTEAQAQVQLQAWYDASAALATGEEYTIGTRKLVRSDAEQVRKMIDYWETKCSQLKSGQSIKSRRIVIRDL